MLREFSILRDMDHPNIIRIYEMYEDEHNFYLVTEYCRGGDLLDILESTKSFTERDAAKIMKQLLSAVLYCHNNGIIHRDIKADNILFAEKNINSDLKLIDFGISVKYTKSPKTNLKLRGKHGTLLYIAPEVLEGIYDEKCDVWSCGVLLFVILSGKFPFMGESSEFISQQITLGKYGFEDHVWDKISQNAKNLISSILMIEPKKRPSIKEILLHPWFEDNYSGRMTESEIKSSNEILQNIINFKSSDIFGHALLTYIVSQVGIDYSHNEYLALFKAMDTDNDGKLTKYELLSVYLDHLSSKGTKGLHNKIDELIKAIDTNKSGVIDYTEFLVAAMKNKEFLNREKLNSVFNLLDENGDGHISVGEWENGIVGMRLRGIDWPNTIQKMDKNKDGLVTNVVYSRYQRKNSLNILKKCFSANKS